MNYYLALRLQALQSVLVPDEEANLRHIFRWYSRTFHTPLHTVEELPLEDVLRSFYEQSYEELSEEDRKTELRELLETPEERKARLRAKDEERAEAFEFSKFTAEEERKKEEKKKLADLKPEEGRPLAIKREVPETSLPKSQPVIPMKDLKELPPDIEMKFVSDEDFEAELNAQAMIPPTKPQSSK